MLAVTLLPLREICEEGTLNTPLMKVSVPELSSLKLPTNSPGEPIWLPVAGRIRHRSKTELEVPSVSTPSIDGLK